MTQQELLDFIADRKNQLQHTHAPLDENGRRIVVEAIAALEKLFLDFTPPHIQAMFNAAQEREIGRKLEGDEAQAFKEFMSAAASLGFLLILHPKQAIDFVAAKKERIIKKYRPTAPEKFAPVIIADNMIDDLRAMLG